MIIMMLVNIIIFKKKQISLNIGFKPASDSDYRNDEIQNQAWLVSV